MTVEIWPGKPHPLGATWIEEGTNFALFSENATGVILCLFDEAGQEIQVPLPKVTNYVWHGFIPGIGPGQQYGFRVEGPYQPQLGHRFNVNKLLIDPYTKALTGDICFGPELFSFPMDDFTNRDRDLDFSFSDSASMMPKSVVIDENFDWQGDRHPDIPWDQTIIYEVHVRGFTQQHPKIPAELRGTYAGMAHPEAIAHLKSLGITAVELLPVHHYNVYPGHLVTTGLHNYWGYDSLGYFAPHAGYSAQPGQQVQEFKAMVKALHEANIEVILDVVYNHTGEGNHLGPTFTLRGIDNAAYYRLVETDPRHYMDFTGCGNSLNVRHPQVLKLIMDSLRYWVQEMHVDGFRFDLASALARELYEVDRLSSFFDIIHQDPVLSTTKLIAEPWDLGEGGYQVGNFPLLWSEWNGKYRDTIRDLWRGERCSLADFAFRFTGSSDLYQDDGRMPHASINFITAHDGFTLNDLVSYNEKHNEANGEGNRDGESYNRSWNCGAEGKTDDPEILALRAQQRRNYLATMMLSQGVPMMLGGDEIARTTQGNNNTYCQDSELSWFNWQLDQGARSLLRFTRKLIAFRQAHPVFSRHHWFFGREIHGSGVVDIGWFNPDGTTIDDRDWHDSSTRAINIFLNGAEIPNLDSRGQRILDDSFLLFFNPSEQRLDFTVPASVNAQKWQVLLDTSDPEGFVEEGKIYKRDQVAVVKARSLVVLACPHCFTKGLCDSADSEIGHCDIG
ncbi:glycogen debranching protein GlgX [cf. Phormidesmis sp. LEGE 11477]|uniref:glycogen debranching protein GlgX n=1 Tax=cf. Phormidesmis sp. LEGE 11477 TaxID=1828680 RepID=UPI00187FFD28|nr:glycogen debranching protein GlgX [cf. Phormidesmis sp. LEGE 11477]MBE9061695.1 glycogen debranching protein GlgX [cf. Phormidesmis sp. LEGE 11477]